VASGGRSPSDFRVVRLFQAGLIVVALLFPAFPAAAQGPQPGRYYPETGHAIEARFVAYYDSHGGLGILGYPITDAFLDPSSGLLIQYFQNARIELVPDLVSGELQPRLSPLGELMGGWGPPLGDGQLPLTGSAGCRYYPESGHRVCHAFLDYYESHGGPAVFGYPISEFELDHERIVQYFQGFRLDWYPDSVDVGSVKIAPLGRLNFDREGYDPSLLKPNLPSNMLLYRVLQLQASASVSKPIVGSSDSQTLYIAVQDQNGNPVEGAAVTVLAHFTDGNQTLLMPQTDTKGISRLPITFKDQRRGETVDLFYWAVLGDMQTTTRDSFRVWW
jgi:hypothetical protein